MVQKGDTVRYLSAVGGGVVTRVDGRIAYVDDDGFETPVQVSDLVVVVPAGHVPDRPGKMMFDQKAFDNGRMEVRLSSSEQKPAMNRQNIVEEEDDFPIEETEYGDNMTVILAFEPADVKKLSTTEISLLLVNDSNYFLDYQLLRRDEEKGWIIVGRGEAAPNELVDIDKFNQADVSKFERLVFQAIAYKKEKPFEIKTPMSVSRKIDVTKFFKMHCFRPGAYFETPVIEITLLREARNK